MLIYIARRLVQMVFVFIGVTILLFILTAVVPGDPITLRAGEKALSPELYASLQREYGLDKPLYVQYVNYVNHLLHGDLGESYQQSRSVTTIYKDFYPNTMKLAVVALALEIVFGLAAGIISAVWKYSFADVLVTLSTSILVAIPVFWLGMLLQTAFGIKFKQWGLPYLPVSGMTGAGFPSWAYYILPAITLAAISTAYAARIMRSQLLEVLNQDYIRTAVAKGFAPGRVMRKHALKNALIPVVTFIGLDFGALMSGAILTETIFNWPGVGYEIYLSIVRRDWPVVMGGVIIIVIVVMIINLLVDISYAFLDPRIRYGSAAE
jgi:ABC-type dipeptide/oligopeptide/nickel transport system permease component